MRIVKVTFNRKFNLGNYESLDVGAEAELAENDTAMEVWTILKDNAEMWFIDQQRKRKEPSPEAKKVASQITSGAEKKPEPTGNPPTELLHSFPEDLRNLLEFIEMPKLWYVKPVSFLGAENFARASQAVRALGGKYVSEGKTSHFEIPKEAQAK